MLQTVIIEDVDSKLYSICTQTSDVA